ncbi:MAG: Fe(3+)-hydroxamate ABC transporter permease FhuB, partial [Vibrio sp.]
MTRQNHLTLFAFALFFMLCIASLQIGNPLSLSHQWQLIIGKEAIDFDEFNFAFGLLPRLVMAILVGSMLGLVGSLMQQLTQNNLTSPLTLGTSSGAWLALIVLNVVWPDLAGDFKAVAAMSGAMLAMILVISIAGFKNITGLPLILSGMVVNILLGAIATAIILLNDQYAQNVFIWGAGDLAQNGWEQVLWLLPRISVAALLLIFAPRILTLMRLGQQGAAARGLNVIPMFALLIFIGLWVVSASITTVGVISFIGLLSPNIARALGARTPRAELLTSMLIGSLALITTDILAKSLSIWTVNLVPSGTAAAAIGAPALVWFSRRALKAQDQLSFKLPPSRDFLSPYAYPVLILGIIVMLVASACLTMTQTGFEFALPDSFNWDLRWPRFLTALFAGIALAMAGTILQRLIYNPLASPDILGISAGASFALVGASVFFGLNIFGSGALVAFAGSLLVLMLLLVLGRKTQFAPGSLILIGIALSALIESLVQFALAQNSQDSYMIINWLAGSTYRVSENSALLLSLSTLILGGLAIRLSRWLSLISA